MPKKNFLAENVDVQIGDDPAKNGRESKRPALLRALRRFEEIRLTDTRLWVAYAFLIWSFVAVNSVIVISAVWVSTERLHLAVLVAFVALWSGMEPLDRLEFAGRQAGGVAGAVSCTIGVIGRWCLWILCIIALTASIEHHWGEG